MNAIAQFLDGIYAGCFKTDAAGRTIFYPNGALGSGYVVPDGAALEAIKRKLRWFFVLICGGAGLIAPFVMRSLEGQDIWTSAAVGAIALAALSLGSMLFLRSLASGFETSDTRLTFGEAVERQARSMPRWFAILQVVIWALGVSGGAMMIFDAGSQAETMKGWAVAAISGVLLALSVYSFRARAG